MLKETVVYMNSITPLTLDEQTGTQIFCRICLAKKKAPPPVPVGCQILYQWMLTHKLPSFKGLWHTAGYISRS